MIIGFLLLPPSANPLRLTNESALEPRLSPRPALSALPRATSDRLAQIQKRLEAGYYLATPIQQHVAARLAEALTES